MSATRMPPVIAPAVVQTCFTPRGPNESAASTT